MGPPQSGSVRSSHTQGSYFSHERDSFQIMQLRKELRVSQEELSLVRRTSARQLELSAAHIRELEEQLESQSGEGSSSWGRGKGKGKGKRRE